VTPVTLNITPISLNGTPTLSVPSRAGGKPIVPRANNMSAGSSTKKMSGPPRLGGAGMGLSIPRFGNDRN